MWWMFFSGRSIDHIDMVHEHQDGKKKPFKCSSCDSTFGDKESLKIHTKSVHEGKKPFRYLLCQKFTKIKIKAFECLKFIRNLRK